MSDALEHEVKIIIDIVSDLRKSQRELDEFSESVGGLPRKAQGAVDGMGRLADRLEKVAGASKQAAAGSRSLSDILTLEERKVGEAARQWELYAKSLSSAGRARWSDQNASNARNLTSARPGSVFDQGQRFDGGSASKASDTTWAREAASRSEAARRALADYDRQLNANTTSYRANTSALAEMLRAEEQAEAALPRLRYALYDVATTAGIFTTAVGGAGVAVTTAFASVESSFTNVERTLDPMFQGVEGIRESLMQMTREMPLSFQQISEIATLGNQLGVGAADLVEFTEVVAKFSTVSGMTAEASAQAFGRLSNILGIPISEASRLASAIELVGVNSAATDVEIIYLAQRLGATATRAGFTYDQVIGLSGALGSLGVAPERAQGVFETYFNSLNESLAEGGEKLQAFSAITGMTVEQLNQAVRSGGGFEVFQKFLAGLQGPDTVELTSALDAVGLSGLRANEVIGRISQRLPLLQQSFAIASQGARENSELNRQYGLILDDLASKWQIFLNALMEFGAAVGAQIAPAAGVLLDTLTNLLQGFAQFAATDTGAAILRLLTLIGSLAVVLGTVVTGAALAGGAMAAFRTVLLEIKGIGLAGMFATLTGGLFGTAKAGVAASGAMTRLRGALLALGRATIIIALLQAAAELVFNFGGSMIWLGNVLVNVGNTLAGFAQQIANFLSTLSPIAGAIGFLVGGGSVGETISGWGESLRSWGQSMQEAETSTTDFGTAANSLNWGDYAGGTDDWADSLGDLGGAAGGAAEQVRTLVDYANDLQGVFQRAFDIRFGGEQGLDAITTGWQKIADAANAAREAAEEHQRKLAEMGADRLIKQYWLTVAENYGDELRAAKLRAELAELDADMAKEKQNLAKAQDDASMSLVGNSAAAIQNRANLLALVGDYQTYLEALAASGMSQRELQAESARLGAEFVQQATQMGFSRSEVDRYALAFTDLTVIINRVPRNITVTANVNPALQALAEFEARARSAGANAGSAIGGGVGGGVDYANSKINDLKWNLQDANDKFNKWLTDNNKWNTSTRSGWRLGGGGGFSSGGYTGGTSTSQVMGAVHGKEFVFSAAATRTIGVNNLAYMHNMAKAGKTPAPVGLGAVAGMVELSPYDRSLLMQIADNIGVTIGSPTLQAVTNGANANSAQRRSG